MIGQSLSHYRITEKLGQGGLGEVYRAEDTNLHRNVAVKVLPDEFSRDPERLARFQRFLMVQVLEPAAPAEITVVLNWMEDLKSRLSLK